MSIRCKGSSRLKASFFLVCFIFANFSSLLQTALLLHRAVLPFLEHMGGLQRLRPLFIQILSLLYGLIPLICFLRDILSSKLIEVFYKGIKGING